MRATENFRKFNDSQRQALDGRRNLAVRANAGSGKTSVLIERVVQLVARSWDEGHPLHLHQLAAITFTRKAATELQARLRKSFGEMRRAAADHAEQRYWTGLIDELPRATIGTIDSFCHKILRDFGWSEDADHPLESNFEPLEDYDKSQFQLKAIDRVINRLSAPPSRSAAASGTGIDPLEQAQAEACNWWAKYEGYWALTRHLAALLNDVVEPEIIFTAHTGSNALAEKVEAAWREIPAVRYLQENRAGIVSRLRELAREIRKAAKAGALLKELEIQVNSVLDNLATPGQEENYRALNSLAAAFLTKAGDPRSTRGLGPVADEVTALHETWHPLLEKFDFDRAGELRALEAADKLALLLRPVYDEYLQLCHEANRFDYTTLARWTRDLLRKSAPVRTRLKDTYRCLMVDEFQDTNALQWEILSWIVGNGPDALLDSDRLFIVGDPQQSIFRFRQADVSVFQRVQDLIAASNEQHGHQNSNTCYDDFQGRQTSTRDERLGLISLAENYRSLWPTPLHLVDRVFQSTFDPVKNGLDLDKNKFEIRYQPLRAGRRQCPDATGAVRYIVPSEDEEDDEEVDPELAETEEEPLGSVQVRIVVEELCALYGQPSYPTSPRTAETSSPGRPEARSPVGARSPDRAPAQETLHWKDMAILLPSRTMVLTALEKELRRRAVPFVVTGGIGFWQRQEVRDIVSLASCLSDAGDELALFAVLRSPLGQLTDTEILFLSQLGLGSLVRGLRALRLAGETLSAPKEVATAGARSPGHASIDEERDWLPAHWQGLPLTVQKALSSMWQSWSAEAKARLRQAAWRFHAWQERVDRLQHADLLQRALEETGAYALYSSAADGQQNLANLQRLFDIIRAEEASLSLSLGSLARRLRDQMNQSLKQEQATLSTEQEAVKIMTVHAAKGLEFPVVAIMRMDRQAWLSSSKPLRVKNESDAAVQPACPIGTITMNVRHPQRPLETYTPRLLRALRELDRAQEIAESRRLFYVATTRAEERLLLAGKQPRSTKNGAGRPRLGWQRWFEEALGITETHKQAGVWQDSERNLRVTIVTELRDSGLVRETEPTVPLEVLDLQPIAEKPLHPLLATTELEEMRRTWQRDRREWWLRYGVHLLPNLDLPPANFPEASSALDSESIGKSVGILAHRLLEMGEGTLSRTLHLRTLVQAMAANLLTEESAVSRGEGEDDSAIPAMQAAVVDAVLAVCQRLMRPGSAGQEIRKLIAAAGPSEVDFVLKLGRWQVTGRFDKLLLSATKQGFEIVDWKTDQDDRAAIVERHRPQMQLYALALYRAGKAALVDGAVPVHLVLLHSLHIERLLFPIAKLEVCAEELVRDLEEMDNDRS